MEHLRKRRPIIALFLSLAMSGLGQMYSGRLKRGLILYLVGFFLVAILLTTGLFFKFYGMIIGLVILLAFKLFVSLEAFFVTKSVGEITPKPYNRWYFYIIILLVSAFAIHPLVSSSIRNYFVRAYKTPSSGMEPALLVGDYFIAKMGIYKLLEGPKRSDIIIFQHPKDPSKDLIKRIIGLEGEKIEISGKKIYIDEKEIKDPWGYYEDLIVMPQGFIERFGPVVVPRNSFFVLGDNRYESLDSRFWGFVPQRGVRGKALYIYWAKNKSRIGLKIE